MFFFFFKFCGPLTQNWLTTIEIQWWDLIYETKGCRFTLVVVFQFIYDFEEMLERILLREDLD
jgi:hypothetical protein